MAYGDFVTKVKNNWEDMGWGYVDFLVIKNNQIKKWLAKELPTVLLNVW